MNIGLRIKELRKNKKLSQLALSKLINIDNSQLSKIEKGKIQPTIQQVLDISSTLNMSTDWILSGKNTEPINEFKLKTDRPLTEQSIPLYNMEAVAGLVPLFDNPNAVKTDEYINIPNLPKCDGALFVTGDSMYPLLKSGDIVAYKQITDFNTDIFWGEMYLISVEVSDEEYISVKYVQKSDKGEQYIKLVSQNSHHQPKDVLLKKVRAMALVKASIRINSMG